MTSLINNIYAEVISRWSSNKHFTLNLPIQNRPTIGNNTNSIVGDFTAVNLLEVNVTQNMSFIERVKEITKRLMEDLEHNSFSGVEVLRELSKVSEEKELLMPIVFTGVLKTDGTVGTIEYGFSHTPQVWIDCQIVDEIDSEDQEKGLMISWDTRKGAIKESIVTEMFESFTETIRILGIKHSEEWKNPLEIIVPSASKKKVICERNKGITNQSRIQQRFVKYAKKNSNKTAVIDAVETVTYGELLERAEYIAGYLRKEFVENRTGLVAIRMKKSVNQIAAVMGVLIAGFSYLPIDIKQPLARQEKILSKANVIVELDEKKVNMILQNLEYRLEKHPEFQNPIAYVIFTSGSTGEPKGVVMSHTAAQNTLISIENMYNISEEDTILGIAELSFDLSVFDIFSVLGVGGTLVLPNPEKGPDASHWGRLLNEYKVTLWNSVPAQAEMLDAFASKSESYPTVRLVLLSGDWINTSLPGRLRKIMTNAQMISLGGATEGGIWSIYHEIDEIEERPTILYGKALLGQWMGVVDEELRICPEYVSGQIAIGGYSLAEGYLGDTTLTKEKFVYVEEEKNRIYLTGDNGRYVENGDIEFLGRLDNQVKINGHRIEIAEIENAIRGMQNIEDCCVVYNQSIGKGVLIAFIKNKISSISYTKEEYRKQLAFFLPPAMIPSEFVNVERFPLSTNGKIDRKGLAESIQKNIKVKHNANQNVDAACVVVPNAAGGGNGANIAKSILAKGIPTLLEHPAHEVEIVNCIRESGSAAFMLNPFYRYIKPIRDFLEAAQIISKHAHLINASLECAIHVLYDGIDILGCALGGLSTWKLGNVAESYTTSMAGGGNRVISGIIGMVPVTFIVNTNVDRNDIDHPLHLYHRIELTFSTGRLCLVNTHGPVIWLPFLHMPRDEYGTLSINVEEEVNIPSGVTIGNVMLPSVKETFEQIWPDAVKKALEILFKQNRTEKMSMAQYQIYVSKLWSEICQKVGYMNIVDYDNFGDIKSIFYDLEKRHLIKKENDGIE